MFFGTLVAGSIASQIKVFLEQPTLFLTTLGTAAPLTSIFFLTYVELNVRGPLLKKKTVNNLQSIFFPTYVELNVRGPLLKNPKNPAVHLLPHLCGAECARALHGSMAFCGPLDTAMKAAFALPLHLLCFQDAS